MLNNAYLLMLAIGGQSNVDYIVKYLLTVLEGEDVGQAQLCRNMGQQIRDRTLYFIQDPRRYLTCFQVGP